MTLAGREQRPCPCDSLLALIVRGEPCGERHAVGVNRRKKGHASNSANFGGVLSRVVTAGRLSDYENVMVSATVKPPHSCTDIEDALCDSLPHPTAGRDQLRGSIGQARATRGIDPRESEVMHSHVDGEVVPWCCQHFR